MASANVSFDNIPASIRKPGKYFEFNTKLAVRTLATNPQTVLIVAQKTADGTAPENTPVQVFDTDTAGKLFGFGSQAARMVRAAMRAYGYVDLSVLPVADDTAGIAASGSLKLTGDATAQGVITLTVADTEVSVAAAAEDSAETLATALTTAVNAERDLPVTAQAATGTVTLTAKNKGTLGNGIVLAYSNTVPGITPTLTAMTGGQKDPDIVEALTAVFAADYTIYCVPWAVQAPLTALREHLDNIGGPMEQRGAIGVFASTGTLSAATTLAGQLNAGRITGALLPGSTTPPEQIAAAPSALLRQAAASLDLQAAVTLIDKGIRPGDHVEDILRTLTGQHQEWMAEQLLAHGMPVGPDNYAALYVCINNGMPGVAKLVLDQGIDFDKYRAWADNKPKSAEYEAAMEALYEYMTEQKNTVQRDGPTMGGMCR